jgi:hypothetical protein
MAASKLNPLPVDYVRPSLAEFLAASNTHRKQDYLSFFEGHEAELRKHYVPQSPELPDPETIPPDPAEDDPEPQTEEENEDAS